MHYAAHAAARVQPRRAAARHGSVDCGGGRGNDTDRTAGVDQPELQCDDDMARRIVHVRAGHTDSHAQFVRTVPPAGGSVPAHITHNQLPRYDALIHTHNARPGTLCSLAHSACDTQRHLCVPRTIVASHLLWSFTAVRCSELWLYAAYSWFPAIWCLAAAGLISDDSTNNLYFIGDTMGKLLYTAALLIINFEIVDHQSAAGK